MHAALNCAVVSTKFVRNARSIELSGGSSALRIPCPTSAAGSTQAATLPGVREEPKYAVT
jgi:hypothetical protein